MRWQFRETLQFNQKIDCTEDFEDLGNTLVNLKKRKQPVDYYLIHRSTKSEMLVNFLLEVLDACHSAGLKVVAIECDTGANSVKALQQLTVSEKTSFFRFHYQGTAV